LTLGKHTSNGQIFGFKINRKLDRSEYNDGLVGVAIIAKDRQGSCGGLWDAAAFALKHPEQGG
jgi:hypothetical protein